MNNGNSDRPILRHPGLAPLWTAMERTRRQQQGTALVLMVFGLVVVAYGIVDKQIWPPLAGGVIASAALFWFYRVLTVQPLARWRRQLRDDPASIVWVYGMVTERMPFGFRLSSMATLHLVDREGDMHCFGLKPEELKLVTKTLNRVCPSAEFGYTKERELMYRGEVTDFDRSEARRFP